ncbi:hypothetical protein T459_02163 [Capsicum annuum]|uniref:F-box associated beta-propeller type 3 domain-containing protein n=1 Tax=Capsicum annuum TaxID=4072 RepID=A0A2G3AJ59_CAPAN|nr:hypothetical protein T459_02163 [Capsicum annuum]
MNLNLYKNILSFLLSEDAFDLTPISPDVEVPYLTTTSASAFHQLIGPCNGLISLSDSLTIILFNPTTRNYKLIPPCPLSIPQGFRRSISGVGFGFDLVAKNYKFVRISEVYKDPCEKDMKVDIFDLCIDSWRELNGQQLPIVFWTPCSEILYKSVFHWFTHADGTIILCFGMSSEKFYNIELPNTIHWFDGKCFGLVILYNCLTLICYPDPMSRNPAKNMMDIWIMKEYSKRELWIKRCSIGPLHIECPLTVCKDNLLLLQSKTGYLIAYDLNSNEVKELNLHGFPTSLRVTVYKESLTLISINGNGAKVQLF